MKLIKKVVLGTTYTVELDQQEMDIIYALTGKMNAVGPLDLVEASEALFELAEEHRSGRYIKLSEYKRERRLGTLTMEGSSEGYE